MTRKVKRVFVETHATDVHEVVYHAFRLYEWKCLHNFDCDSEVETSYGIVKFPHEGIQCWINLHIA